MATTLKAERRPYLYENDAANILSLFEGRCGHRWVGASCGSYRCPVCGDYDGDHHLVCFEPIPVQVDDWGCAWDILAKTASPAEGEGYLPYPSRYVPRSEL